MTEANKIKIYLRGTKLFGSEEAFGKWLLTPNPKLCTEKYRRCPIDYSWTFIGKLITKVKADGKTV
jgi:hypothetical protein